MKASSSTKVISSVRLRLGLIVAENQLMKERMKCVRESELPRPNLSLPGQLYTLEPQAQKKSPASTYGDLSTVLIFTQSNPGFLCMFARRLFCQPHFVVRHINFVPPHSTPFFNLLRAQRHVLMAQLIRFASLPPTY